MVTDAVRRQGLISLFVLVLEMHAFVFPLVRKRRILGNSHMHLEAHPSWWVHRGMRNLLTDACQDYSSTSFLVDALNQPVNKVRKVRICIGRATSYATAAPERILRWSVLSLFKITVTRKIFE